MNILITGALGASGKTISRYLQSIKSNHKIFRTDIHFDDASDYIQADLGEKEKAVKLLDLVNPDQIYHLAGAFSNNFSVDMRSNVITTKNIFDCLINREKQPRVLIIGSSAEYGLIEESGNPINEDHQLNPCSIYGLTKSFQTQLMRYYFNVYSLDIVMARTFNLLGDGLSKKLFIGNLYHQIQRYKQGKIEKIRLGNLKNKRDYIDIKSAIKYYRKIMSLGKAGEIYNVGTGKSLKIEDLLKSVLDKNGLGMDCVQISQSMRNSKFDIKDIYADIGKLKYLDNQ